jgi:hypothetical protein
LGPYQIPGQAENLCVFPEEKSALAERECGKELGKRRKILLSYKKAM